MIRFRITNSPVFQNTGQKHTKIRQYQTDEMLPQIKELSDIKMPVAIDIPAGYTKLGIDKLDNGQEIHNYRLSNGLRVSILPMETNCTVIRTFVNTGAVNENDEERGISHFLEHMAFNGTKGTYGYKKLSTGDVFRITGNIGGETNAATNFALTDYYIQAPIFYDSDLEEIISIQGAMMNNLELPESMIIKERGPVISEINMYTDFPENYAYNLALKNLYNLDTTSDDYIAGKVENIRNLTRENIESYYRNNYYPANMYTTLAGDVEPDDAIKLIAKHFHTKIENPPQRNINKLTPINNPIRRDIISPKTKEAIGYILFNGPANKNLKDTLVFNYIENLLIGGADTILEKRYNDKNISMGFYRDKISTNPNDGQAVYFAFISTENEVDNALTILYDELANFKRPSDSEVERIKRGILNDFERCCQTPSDILYILGNSHFKSGDGSITDYKKTIESITADDIVRCVNSYLDLNKASIVIVHPRDKKTPNPENISDISNVSFKGKREKRIIKSENLKQYALSNNYDVCTYDTTSDYRYLTYHIDASSLPPQKPGVYKLLDYIIKSGTDTISNVDFDRVKSQNLITSNISVSPHSISVSLSADKSDMKLGIKLVEEQLLHPALNETNLYKAKKNLQINWEGNIPSSSEIVLAEAFPDHPKNASADEILENIDDITLDDVKDLYRHIIENCTGSVTFTTSKNEPEYTEYLLSEINSMPKVHHKTFKATDTFTPVQKSKVVYDINNNSQADICIGYKYKTNSNIRDEIIFSLLSGLLSKNAFNELREKQHLAYLVESYTINFDRKNNLLMCNILTTTEDEGTGETYYDNVKKSITGFHKLIKDIQTGNFTNEDFEAAKLVMKGELLCCGNTDRQKINTINSDLNEVYGALGTNLAYSIIDSISKDEIINAANYIFTNKPLYGITGSEETINQNDKFLKSLENNN